MCVVRTGKMRAARAHARILSSRAERSTQLESAPVVRTNSGCQQRNDATIPTTFDIMPLSIDPLLRATLPQKTIESLFEDIDFFRKAFGIMVCISVIYPTVHWLLKNKFQSYRELGSSVKQVTTLHHSVEAILLSMFLLPFSYFMFRVNFIGDEYMDMEGSKSDMQSVFLLCIGM